MAAFKAAMTSQADMASYITHTLQLFTINSLQAWLQGSSWTDYKIMFALYFFLFFLSLNKRKTDIFGITLIEIDQI